MKVFKDKNLHSLVAALLLAASPAMSQETLTGELMFPGYRYTRENIAITDPLHWPVPAVVQFHSISNPSVQKRALSDVLRYSTAALVDLDIVGFPIEMFGRGALSPDANFVILEVDEQSYPKLIDGSILLEHSTFNDNDLLKQLTSMGFVEQATGCHARLLADESNQILAFAIAYRADLDAGASLGCVASMIPYAFGLDSGVNSLDAAKLSAGAPPRFRFTIESERTLALSAAGFCRRFLGRTDIECPYALIKSVMRFHHKLAQKF